MSLIKNILAHKDTFQTVFTLPEISQITGIHEEDKLYSALTYAVSTRELKRITRGIYVLNDNYSRLELGNKLRKPSYISLYTILEEAGILFQPYSSIFLIANRSEQIEIEGQKYIYRKINTEILLNRLGLFEEQGLTKATVERAICDKIYLDGIEHLDNIRNIDWQLMQELNAKLYSQHKLIDRFIKENSHD